MTGRATQIRRLAADGPASLLGAWRHRRDFRDLVSYCFFIGHPRSGHSIVGGLLDAHPDVVIAHEQGDLMYINAHFSRLQLFYLLLRNARHAAAGQRRSGSYLYEVPGQWQGRFRSLRVVGDKQGGGAVLRLERRPSLLARLRRTVRLPLRCIHVVRHPLDNITTICRKADVHGIDPGLDAAVDYYFGLCEIITEVRTKLAADEIFELRHEAFVEHPRHCLDQLCRFIGVTAEPDYLDACASVVRPTPHQSREAIDWPRESTDRVMRRCRAFPFLDAYTNRESDGPG
jgi:hypothetical protein